MMLLNYTTELGRPQDQFNKLDPILQAIYFDAANFLFFKFSKSFLITSIYRDSNPHSVHAYYRGIDADVCDGKAYEGGVLPMEAEIVACYINKKYRYNPANNKYVLVYGDRDPDGNHDTHGHIQVCKFTALRA
jgi:hypothetical protein